MKRIWKWLLILLAVIAVAQIPFVYRRVALGNVASAIAQDDAARTVITNDRYDEYKGIIHAHTSLGGHSTGSFDELIPAANANGLDFVLMTEHWASEYDTSALTLNGKFGNTIFVGGNEIDTANSDRFLMIPGSADAASLRLSPTNDVIAKLHAENRLALITYPEKFNTWDSSFDGIEVFSLHTAASKMNKVTAFFDMIWSGSAYPQLMFARYFVRPDANLKRFDDTAQRRPITLFTGTDAHSNIGFHIFGDDAGHKFINFKYDPYVTMFSISRCHILVPKGQPLTRELIIDTVKAGRVFAGLDILGDTTGFSFTAGDSTMGESVPYTGDLMLKAAAPLNAHFKLFKNGAPVADLTGTSRFEYKPDGPGEYRIEAYRDTLGEPFSLMPWIMSDPIYVR